MRIKTRGALSLSRTLSRAYFFYAGVKQEWQAREKKRREVFRDGVERNRDESEKKREEREEEGGGEMDGDETRVGEEEAQQGMPGH